MLFNFLNVGYILRYPQPMQITYPDVYSDKTGKLLNDRTIRDVNHVRKSLKIVVIKILWKVCLIINTNIYHNIVIISQLWNQLTVVFISKKTNARVF